MFISIIIPTYNRNNVLCDTINSVYEVTEIDKVTNFEIIIVDQSKEHDKNTIEFLDMISKKKKNFSLYNLTIANLPNARNYGISKAIGDIILFLDDDIILQPNYFRSLLDSYLNEDVKSVVGRILLKNETNDNVLLNNQSYIKKILKKTLMSIIDSRKNFIITSYGLILSNTSSSKKAYVDSGMGCNMSFKKEVFNELGLFDTSYIGNAIREETDIFIRLCKHDYKILYNPDMFLYHVMSNTGGCRYEYDINYWKKYFFNQCYFYKKNFNYGFIKVGILLGFDIIKCMSKNINAIKILKEVYPK